jgi:hypothetical protein
MMAFGVAGRFVQNSTRARYSLGDCLSDFRTGSEEVLNGDFPAFPVSPASLAQMDVCENTLISPGFRITV